MPEMWMPEAEKHNYVGNYGDMEGGPSRAVWHATSNAQTDGFVAHLRWFTGAGKAAIPHLLWHPHTGEIAQFMPANSRALALRNAGNVRTNRTGKYCIQIEVCFTKGLNGYNHISETPCKNLDKIVAWLRSLGIPDVWPGGEPTGWARDTVSLTTWTTAGGHYGHSQVPGNDHVDPGKMPDLFGAEEPDPQPEPEPEPECRCDDGECCCCQCDDDTDEPTPQPKPLPVVDLSKLRGAAKSNPSMSGSPVTYSGVKVVEKALASLGFLDAKWVDGHFGTTTITAYSRWQKKYSRDKKLGWTGKDVNGIPGLQSLKGLAAKTKMFTVKP